MMRLMLSEYQLDISERKGGKWSHTSWIKTKDDCTRKSLRLNMKYFLRKRYYENGCIFLGGKKGSDFFSPVIYSFENKSLYWEKKIQRQIAFFERKRWQLCSFARITAENKLQYYEKKKSQDLMSWKKKSVLLILPQCDPNSPSYHPLRSRLLPPCLSFTWRLDPPL